MAHYLDMIENPQDLKKLHADQLDLLADEMRTKIIDVVSKNGGHLASSLGAVELTIALHYVFESPEDKFVWDVGHQCYPHKIITGRKKEFETIRKKNGLSGFPKVHESPHDAFGTGHSSTSISAALGLAKGRDLRGEHDKKVVAIIGDGSMTGGMAYEALNNAGSIGRNFIVILNDNKMAISRSVGAMSAYLNRILTSNIYNTVKVDIEHLIEKIPKIGKPSIRLAQKIEESLKGLMVPGIIFEEMGFRYIGPVDGHDIKSLIRIFQSIKKTDKPIFLHVITKKGKGYIHSENDPEIFHGTGSFDLESGEVLKKVKNKTYTEEFGDIITDCARSDSRVVAITAAMTHGTGLLKFSELFPNRFFDVGIAEEHAVTFAAGLALQGHRPVVAIYSTFLQRAYDQIVHDVCLQNLPVIFAIDRAGVVGEDGPTHHGVFDISYLRHIPNMVIMQPRDVKEMRSMFNLALNHNGPVAIRYPRCTSAEYDKNQSLDSLSIGEADYMCSGKDGVIYALGEMVSVAHGARTILSSYGIDIGVVNMRFIKPLDRELIKKISEKTKTFITIEEHALAGGFGTALFEICEEEQIKDISILRIGIGDTFVEHGSRNELLDALSLTPEAVARCIAMKIFGHNSTLMHSLNEGEVPHAKIINFKG
ncbi:MAG: 1-deoxy-D-xylulose-5-phosphate synthase [Candidatus Ancaeobacter aquaticus]|nr:1-deoxy-D-xylulose-5-phosphate synthase [Candidatus Ancaeobacter aquaticus]